MKERKVSEDPFVTALAYELNNIYQEHYYKRHTRHENQKHKELTPEIAFGVITGCTTGGAVIGTAVPGIGNAIGAAAGLGIGITTVASMAIDNNRQNKKLDNANNVVEVLNKISKGNNENINKLFNLAAKEIIQNRKNILKGFSKRDAHPIAEHLAKHAMAALKQYQSETVNPNAEDLKKAMVEKVAECKSKKANLKELYWHHGLFSLNKIARGVDNDENSNTPSTKKSIVI